MDPRTCFMLTSNWFGAPFGHGRRTLLPASSQRLGALVHRAEDHQRTEQGATAGISSSPLPGGAPDRVCRRGQRGCGWGSLAVATHGGGAARAGGDRPPGARPAAARPPRVGPAGGPTWSPIQNGRPPRRTRRRSQGSEFCYSTYPAAASCPLFHSDDLRGGPHGRARGRAIAQAVLSATSGAGRGPPPSDPVSGGVRAGERRWASEVGRRGRRPPDRDAQAAARA
jgi:hypothetical protein